MSKLETHIIGIPSWVDVMVETTEQREALMKFYSSLYGWTWDVGEEQMGYYSMANLNGAPVMGMGQGPGGVGAMVPYFLTDDINASTATATELGGNVLMGPMEVPGAGIMALVIDPTGAMHGLWQAREFEGFGAAYEAGAAGWWDHASDDPAAAAKYYTALTGHTVIEPSPGMQVLNVGEQWFASLSQNQVPERPQAQWNSIYVVESLEAARNKIRELGGTIVLEEMPVPGSAICVFIEPVMNTAVTIMGAGSPE
ncbi:MAG: VOC family protein [Acidimicrobiales bacterium]|jgi:predicted enzyme related to lactoylglutathione lyase